MVGIKIKAKGWDNKYIVMDAKSGQIIDNNGKSFNMMTAKEKVWELYKEPEPTISSTDNKELINIIKSLTDEVKSLKETINNQEATTVKVKSNVDSYDVADEVVNSVVDKIQKAIKENMPQEDKNEETVKLFYGVTKLDEVRELFKTELTNCKKQKEVLKIITKFIPYCWMSNKKINTAIRYYTDLRNIIKEVGGKYQDLALDLFIIPADVHEKVKSINTAKTINKLSNKETFAINDINNIITTFKGYTEVALNLGDNATIEEFKAKGLPVAKQQKIQQARSYLYATYLALATGRRNTEILKSLEIVNKDNKWWYKGVAKKGADDIMIEAFSLDTDFKFLQQLLSRLRKDIDTSKMTNKQVNSKYSHVFNRSLKRLTGTDYTFHDLREIYAEVAYIKHGRDNGTEREEMDFKAKILGHEIDEERLLSTEHYMTKKGE
jgi:hypothetical protein